MWKFLKIFVKRLMRDLVDFLLMITVIGILIATLLDPNVVKVFINMIFFALLLVFYSIFAMWRLGGFSDLLNEYVKDDKDRLFLGMLPYEDRNEEIKKGPIEYLFIVFWIGLLIIAIVFM